MSAKNRSRCEQIHFRALPSVGMPDPQAILALIRQLLRDRSERAKQMPADVRTEIEPKNTKG